MAKHKKRYHSSMGGELQRVGGEGVYRAMVQDHEASRDMMQGRDGSMISQDPHAMSGLPRRIMYKEYPKAEYDLDGELYGNIIGIDRQMSEDAAVTKRVVRPRKI